MFLTNDSEDPPDTSLFTTGSLPERRVGALVLKHISSLTQLAYLFTKALGSDKFLELTKKIKLIECLNLDMIRKEFGI